jgi:hypothetical protein
MAASKRDIRQWFEAGVAAGRTHMIIVCDTWDHDDFPVYVMSNESVEARMRYYDSDSNKIMEVYNLLKPMKPQLDADRAWDTERVPPSGKQSVKPGFAAELVEITRKTLEARTKSVQQSEAAQKARELAEAEKQAAIWKKEAESMYQESIEELYVEANKGKNKMWVCVAIGTLLVPSGRDLAIMERFEKEGFKASMSKNDTDDTVIEVAW